MAVEDRISHHVTDQPRPGTIAWLGRTTRRGLIAWVLADARARVCRRWVGETHDRTGSWSRIAA